MHQQWLFPDILSEPGLYLIRSGQRPLYFNWNNDLLGQVKRHIEVAGEEMVPPWLLEGLGNADGLDYIWLPGYKARQLQEMRMVQVTKLQPWLNLLDFGEVA